MQSKGDSSTRPKTVFIKKGELVPKPADPVDKRNDFVGWYKEQACTNPWNFETDRVDTWHFLYAKWTEKLCEVQFDLRGIGSPQPDKQSVKPGEKVTKPATDPTSPKYRFAGWYKDAERKTAWNFEKDVVPADTFNLQIYAKWLADITFEMNGHGQQVAAQEVMDGAKIEEPKAPTADQFHFAGWFKDKALKEAWDFGKDTPDGHMTLYAKWVDDKAITLTAKDAKHQYTLSDIYHKGNLLTQSYVESNFPNAKLVLKIKEVPFNSVEYNKIDVVKDRDNHLFDAEVGYYKTVNDKEEFIKIDDLKGQLTIQIIGFKNEDVRAYVLEDKNQSGKFDLNPITPVTVKDDSYSFAAPHFSYYLLSFAPTPKPEPVPTINPTPQPSSEPGSPYHPYWRRPHSDTSSNTPSNAPVNVQPQQPDKPAGNLPKTGEAFSYWPLLAGAMALLLLLTRKKLN